jgi:hypothetical protein
MASSGRESVAATVATNEVETLFLNVNKGFHLQTTLLPHPTSLMIGHLPLEGNINNLRKGLILIQQFVLSSRCRAWLHSCQNAVQSTGGTHMRVLHGSVMLKLLTLPLKGKANLMAIKCEVLNETWPS